MEAAGYRATVAGGTATLETLARRQQDESNIANFAAYRGGGSAGYPGGQVSRYSGGFAEAVQAPFAGVDAPSADTSAAVAVSPAGAFEKPLGAARAQLHETYIVAETQDSIVIVDQHAAHERIVYERLKRGLADGGIKRQGLLIPEVVEVGEGEAAALEEQAEALADLGLVLEPFGASAVVVREVPALFGSGNVCRLGQGSGGGNPARRQRVGPSRTPGSGCLADGVSRQCPGGSPADT